MLRRSFQQCGGDEVQVAAKAGFSLRVVRAATGGSWTALGVVVRSPDFLLFFFLVFCFCVHGGAHSFFHYFFLSALSSCD